MIVLEGSIELALFFSVALSYIQGYGTVIRCEGQKLDWGDRFYVVLNPTDRRKPHLLPQLPSSLRDTLESYFSEQKKVGMALLELIGKTIGMDKKEVEEMFDDGLQSMRMSYYPPYPHPEQVVGIRPHSDATGITILHQANGVEGFQIKKNGVWMPITFLPHAFVVNVGDIMEILSNGMYTSIEHRALVNSEKERFSIAMFFNPKFEAEVGPLKSLISSQNPPVVCEESSLQECFAIDGDGSSSKSGKNEEAVIPEGFENVEASEMQCILRNEDVPASCDNDACSLKHFDITKDPLDHYYIGVNGQRNNRKWHKKVQQDWSILQSNLPEEIYVRVYEDRMDLLRAVIVGPYGTPYQDGLFFFDFHLPPEYPDVPPSAYYHSGGWRINPNLYEEGKVCLSLLNTWTGKGNEVWDPNSSSILQVLVSLQGLVLNSKPYFNEAGYDKQVGTAEGEKNSLSYNENTFLLNCKTMMYLIRKPPKDFEVLIKEHFRSRGHNILKACDAYMKGYLIGSLTRDASVSDNSSANSNSTGFKLMLAKIVPKLYLSLSEVGADCEEFKHLKEL